MNGLAFFGVGAVRLFLMQALIVVAEVFVAANDFDFNADIRQDKERLLVGREEVAPLVGHVDGVGAFVDDKIELLVEFV